ncbi:MAG: hypothetical protein HETSPECPRED_007750 [Heterodermia speciosa]|uniref:Uncharacterized protein n=1 Tax=Heterodermia speciosa TaxID=116794 RepID=A0A8H3FU60_9LECA|nr:MAG: hypothetical protein HETSPECPRED_007750 [Heterodermia speciosa]
MLSSNLSVPRILLVRRHLRPPKHLFPDRKLRPFTSNSQLLLVSSQTPRPQLPFLHARSSQHLLRFNLQSQLARYLTTETKQELKVASKLVGYFYALVFLGIIIYLGVQNEYLHRTYAPPPEWTISSRLLYCNVRLKEDPNANIGRDIDKANCGVLWRELIKRLENPEKDGEGLRPILQEEGAIYVEGVGKTGFDISSRSEPWRRAYFEAIMGAARTAESLDGWVRDTTRNMIFPQAVVIGPSNPRPKPVPLGANPAPLEGNCLPAFEKPEAYYMKILTTHGFTSGQRLAAALAHGDWLDFKGLPSSAEEMYDWGLDIAMGSLPVGVNNVVDNQTGIINPHAKHISSNILAATTALATHHARNNNLASALPILLSILRARRQLSFPPVTPPPAEIPQEDNSMGFVTMRWFVKDIIFSYPEYPPAPPTGDDIPLRTPTCICEEAGLMAHIGEIFFASSSQASASQNSTPKASGLSWTRDAVELAEMMLASIPSGDEDEEARVKCADCFRVGVTNWKYMVESMLREEQAREKELSEMAKKKASWFWGNSTSNAEAPDNISRWEREASMVDSRMQDIKAGAKTEEERRRAMGIGMGVLRGVFG